MSTIHMLTELMPTSYECWGYRKNSRHRWTRYYMAYKNGVIYFFPNPNAELSKTMEIKSEHEITLVALPDHPLSIKIKMKNEIEHFISVDDADSVKSLIYHFNQLKTEKIPEVFIENSPQRARLRRKQTITSMVDTIPTTGRIRSMSFASEVNSRTFNGRINITEIHSLVSWLRNDINSLYSTFMEYIPILDDLAIGDMIDFKIRVNENGEEIELAIVTKSKVAHDTMIQFFKSMELDEEQIKMFDDVCREEMIEHYVLLSKKGGKRIGWRMDLPKGELVDHIKTLQFDTEMVIAYSIFESEAIGKVIQTGKTITPNGHPINEIQVEMSGNPSVKYKKLLNLTEHFGFDIMKEKIDFVEKLYIFNRVVVVLQTCNSKIVAMKILIEKLDLKSLEKYFHPLNWFNHDYYRSCSIGIKFLELIEVRNDDIDDGFIKGFQYVLHYDCGIERK